MWEELDTLSLFPPQVQSGSPSMWRAPGCPGRQRWAHRGGRSRESPAPAVSVCRALLPALPGEEDLLCWEQGLQPRHSPHSCLPSAQPCLGRRTLCAGSRLCSLCTVLTAVSFCGWPWCAAGTAVPGSSPATQSNALLAFS